MRSRGKAAGTLNPWRPNPRRPPSYDLKAADRKRNLAIQIGLTAVVVIFAVALVLYIVMSADKKPHGRRVPSRSGWTSSNAHQEGGQPTNPRSCCRCTRISCARTAASSRSSSGRRCASSSTRCRRRRLLHGRASWTARATGLLVARGGAAYCVADETTEAFQRFHDALFLQQPSEGARVYPDNARLIEIARQAGAGGQRPRLHRQGALRRDGRRAWPQPRASRRPRPSGSTARTTNTARRTRWSPRSRRSSATCPGLDGAAPAPAPARAAPAAAPVPPDPRRP